MPDREYGGGNYNSGYGGGSSARENPRAGDTPGFGTGGGGSVGGGGGYGVDVGGGLARGDGGRNDYMDQGRGSNVTGTRPQPPVEQAAGVGPGGAVNAAGPSPTIPVGVGQYPMGGGLSLFSTPAPMAPNTIGVPTINLTVPTYGATVFDQIKPITPISISTVAPGTQSIPGYQASQTYSGPHGRTMTDAERWAGGGVFNNLESLYDLPEGTIGRIMKTESTYGTDPRAFTLRSGPSGPFQISESTGKGLGVVGPGFDYRLDPVESAAAAAKYASEISGSLRSTLGRTPTTGEIGLGYQQGPGGAKALLGNPNLSAKEALAKAIGGDVEEAARRIKANGGNPDAPASQFTAQKISQYGGGPANPPTLTAGLDKLMAAVTGTTSDVVKAAVSAPAKFADTLESMFVSPANAGTPVTAGNIPTPSPVLRSYKEAGSSPDVFQGSKASAAQGSTGFAVPGGQQTAAQAASSSPQDFGDWLGGLFDTSGRIKQLEAQGKTATYAGEDPADIKQRYADQFTGGDVNKVQSRIVDFGQGPVVDYYAKDLGTAIMEGFASPFKAVGDMIGGQGIQSLPQGSSVRDRRFMDLFSQNVPSRGYGPNGDLTFEEYRQIYGR
jgi:hypothetical protein